MSSFEVAVIPLLKIEGGHANNSWDRGGETVCGITRASYPNDIIWTLPPSEQPARAKVIYEQDFWNKGNYGRIFSQAIANKVLDMSVNQGLHQANLNLQRAVNCAYGGKVVEVDGKIGDKTIKAINDLHYQISGDVKIVCALRGLNCGFYVFLQKKNKEDNKNTGWEARGYA